MQLRLKMIHNDFAPIIMDDPVEILVLVDLCQFQRLLVQIIFNEVVLSHD